MKLDKLFIEKWFKIDYIIGMAIGTIIGVFFIIIPTYSIILNEKEPTNETKIEYIETIRYATEKEQIEHDREELEMIAKVVYGEAGNCSKTEKAAVIWCVLNRVDDNRFPDNITDVITQENQFSGYYESNFAYSEYVELANDVMTRWIFEKTAVGDIGRVIPKEYMWFYGDGKHNYFRDQYNGNYNIWDWSLESPYRE